MPPLSYPDHITHYAFSKSLNPWFAKWLGRRVADINDFIGRAEEIESIPLPDEEDASDEETPSDLETQADDDESAEDAKMRLIEELEKDLRRESLWYGKREMRRPSH